MLRAKGKKTGSGLQKSGPWSNHKVGHETANWDLVGFFFFFRFCGQGFRASQGAAPCEGCSEGPTARYVPNRIANLHTLHPYWSGIMKFTISHQLKILLLNLSQGSRMWSCSAHFGSTRPVGFRIYNMQSGVYSPVKLTSGDTMTRASVPLPESPVN